MNNSDFKQTAENYRKEMMRLYGNSIPPKQVSAQSMPKSQPPEDDVSLEETENSVFEDTEADIKEPESQESEIKESENKMADISIEERFPPPVLPDFIINRPPSDRNTSYGYLKVSVKTGNGGLPLSNSLVTVSEIKDGKENIVKLMSTDSSGSTEILHLPAPPKPPGNTTQDYEQYAKYNISAYSKGYFREASIDVPIFEGITSIQNFYLIPEPFNYNSGERTIVDRNPEPTI